VHRATASAGGRSQLRRSRG